ncbi:RepB family plasmid replication initiator protein [Vibrio alginolyticus]|uniref:RepB family plasmid replication initiator protein n=1 Tax=Vibrio alginolyticus TaxID=663 RepID=UPI00215C6252|nr:RepB family plasmid replication initiator protein [Vibrio alginolyticus]MCR9352124.1 RepB family plasmid replication initiator protein [Vibrio alginolyticus]MCR9362559.1 RepB family plasmid replication initiator protein [Vibrio alginolyticus]
MAQNDSKNDLTVRQANALTTAAYSLTRYEKRLVYMCLKRINQENPTSEHLKTMEYGQYPITISNKEFIEYFEVDGESKKNLSRDIHRAAQSLHEKSVVIYLPDEDSKDGEKAYDAIHWTTKQSYRPKRGHIVLHLNAELVSIINKTTSNYTQLLIGEAGNLSSVYTMRLYEAINQWKNLRHNLILDVDWMRSRWQLPSSYARTAVLKKRWLKPAIDELNKLHTFKSLSYEDVRKGTKTVAFKFSWELSKKAPSKLSLARSALKAINNNLQPKQSEMIALTEQIGQLLLNGEDISPVVLGSIKKFGEESKDAKGSSMKKPNNVIDVTDYEIVTSDED